MDRRLIPAIGLTQVQRMAEEDENASRMYRSTRSGPTPFSLADLFDAIEDVARALRPEAAVRFLLARHVVVVGGDEWALDGDLALWRKARIFATQLWWWGFLNRRYGEDVLTYQRQK